ncbi:MULTISPECIES: YbgC/FadM family acyl-CoA thioesterase [Hydrogenophaga]|uniref:4-hydroxybenzoyl-CoA thioesterase n=1 Tax=Hydrogenophaga intermedia TaxID=65786 RepID=A0A1L1PKK7_HYDIT|nr:MULTISPECIES: YbgC/FadM family acyl-CoA thioesterase [Hydrogenophaga]TMU72451.1 YbgC/FadM family acyl-CoA thioesterase [Hydrogenophaga intermedia]CDN87467.1 4-hydroxybenzoyl-CoA thioesterase [Hydrogenophaga intermedia]
MTTRLTRDDFRFFHRLRVRWAEVDMQKIVFNAHYLMYFDTAISDYWRALALPYEESMHSLDGDLYVVKATVEYHASARADEQIDVAMKCSRVGTSSMAFTGAIFRGDEHLITGEIVYVFADPATQRSRPVPQALRDILLGHEAGEDMLDLRVGGWDELGEGARQLRAEVFVQEQGIPLELEMDEADATAVHAVARNRLGRVVATGRLLRGEPGVGKIGRMAVHRVLRGGSLGRRVLFALMDAARARGDREVVLNAQRSAVGFYARLGFATRGEPYEEAGIPHQTMVKAL